MYFLDVVFLHQGVRDPDRFSDKSQGRRQIYKLMCLAASFCTIREYMESRRIKSSFFVHSTEVMCQ